MNYSKVASDVIQAVGKDNLIAAAHCATRLRLVLKDDTETDPFGRLAETCRDD